MLFIMISPNSVDHLLQVAVIEDVVGDYVKLKRAGSRYKGNCPFHDEKTPSFVVTPNMGIYKCFGCQKGGNSIQFMMDIDNLTFTEAARQLAKRYGIELVETNSENKDAEMQPKRKKENLQAVNDFALEFFQSQLNDSEEGKTVALPYFRERGYTPETIKFWNLGFSPSGWDDFYLRATKLGYTEDFLLSAGLIKQRDKDGSYYDLFRNRVIFPLLGVTGKVVGFAGRIMGKADKAPKYVNSPETLLYKKSDFLFALFQAKASIRKADKAYLMEGYTDVMTLHQSGITNAVASSGTALTPGQIKLIKRFTDNTTIIYDGDTAGMKASIRGINLLLEGGLNVRVVPMPEGEDPDSYCKKLGPEGFQKYLDDNEQNFITFKAKLLLEGAQKDPLKKSDALRDIIESVALIEDPLKRDVLIKELDQIFDINSDLIYNELSKELRKIHQKEQKNLLDEVTQLITVAQPENQVLEDHKLTDAHQEKALLRLLLLYGGKVFSEDKKVADFIIEEYSRDEVFQFNQDENRYIMKFIIDNYTGGEWFEPEFFTRSIDAKIVNFAAEIYSVENKLSDAFASNLIYVKKEEENYLQEIVDVFLHLRRTKIEEIIIAQQKKLLEPDIDDLEIMEFITHLNTVKMQIAKQIGAVVTR